MARFLIASWDGGGNTPPAYHLGARLRRRGHQVGMTGWPSVAARAGAGAFFVPEPARPLLRAARAFLQLRGTPPTKALLSAGISAHAHRLTASARACGLALPVTHHTLAQSWHLRADAWWVGTALHVAEQVPP